MKSILTFSIFLLFSVSVPAKDQAQMKLKGNELTLFDDSQTDYLRQNLIHLFDSSRLIHTTNKGKTEALLKKIQGESYIHLSLEEPARIVVEGKALKITKLWVTLRESDGFVYNWIFKQPTGELVALNKPQGLLMKQFAPYTLQLIKKQNKANSRSSQPR